MKRMIVAALALILAVCAPLAACGPRVANDAGTLQIYIANFGYGYEWLEDMADAFVEQDWVQEKHPGLERGDIVTEHNSDRSYAIERIMQGDSNTIDLFFSVTSGADRYEQQYRDGQSYFENLETLYEETTIPGEGDLTIAEKMDDNFLAMSTFTRRDGTTTYYAFPWVAGMQGLLYNATAFSTLGIEVPRTTNELIARCTDILGKDRTPFIFSSRENYWTCTMFLIWWAQYEGLENYSNFYQGITGVNEQGIAEMGPEVYEQTGRLRSLEVIENLIMYPTPNIHENVNTLTFTQAQARFLLGQGLMMPNGDWFETEMSRTKEEDNVTDEFTFMPSPVISSITEQLDTPISDTQLSQIVKLIDEGASSAADVASVAAITEDDFDKLYEARKLVLPVGNHNAYIPSYATGKELAKDFLLFMSTDVASRIFIESTHGASTPFEYDVETEDPALYDSLATLQKDRLRMQQDAIFMLNENTYAGSYYGGIVRFTDDRTNIDALFTARNENDRMTAEEIYKAEIARWTPERWENVLINMGLR